MALPEDAIEAMAKYEARAVKRFDPDEEHDTMPYFTVSRRADGGHAVEGHGHAGHDNEPRMAVMAHYLTRSVLPYIERGADVRGSYRIELHDSYSYLEPDASKDRRGSLSFSRRRADQGRVAAIPNIFQLGNHGDALAARDPLAWDAKDDVATFLGSTTGARDPTRNARVAAAVWALGQPAEAVRIKLSHVVQMDEARLREAVGGEDGLRAILAAAEPPSELFRHKLLLDLPGNTCSWSRLPMIMASNSLAMCVQHGDVEWFYPLLASARAVVPLGDVRDLPRARLEALANPDQARERVRNANAFCASYMTSGAGFLFLKHFLEEVAHLRAP
jgi:hypothetical protein